MFNINRYIYQPITTLSIAAFLSIVLAASPKPQTNHLLKSYLNLIPAVQYLLLQKSVCSGSAYTLSPLKARLVRLRLLD